jgi:hypothetical protein
MRHIPGLRHGLLVCLAALFVTAVVDAQPPRGGRGGQEGGRGGQEGRRGGQEGGRGGQEGRRGGQEGRRGGQEGRRGGQQGRGGQFRGGSFGGFGGSVNRATLLGAAKVREELNIDAGQGATIDAALESYRDERREGTQIDFRALRDMEEDERAALLEKSRKEREELTKKTDDVLNALLEPGQVGRLDQISLQLRLKGNVVDVLASDDIRKKLSINEEQMAKLTKVVDDSTAAQEEMRNRMRAAFQGGGGASGIDFDSIRAEGEKLRTTASTAAMAVLTADQTKQLNGLKGAAFEIDMRQLGGRGGFGRGSRGGGGRPGGNGGPGGQGGRRGTRPPADDPV